MDYKMLTIGTIYLVLLSCTSKPKMINNGIVEMKTAFYDSRGTPSFIDLKQVWYKDSSTIEKINRTDFLTVGSKTTVTYSTLLFRFIDLRQKIFYDYKHFSDSAMPINKAPLPDSMMTDYGWSYYSHKVRRIQGIPQELSDTLIGHLNYRRIRFNFIGDELAKGYKIGYYRCDEKARMFSLEKSYSKKINCTMIRFEDFQYGLTIPLVTVDVEILSDSLNSEELRIFDAWQKNLMKYPVNE